MYIAFTYFEQENIVSEFAQLDHVGALRDFRTVLVARYELNIQGRHLAKSEPNWSCLKPSNRKLHIETFGFFHIFDLGQN